MSDYSRMETADLIARFIAQVGRVGSSATYPKLPPRSPEAEAIFKDMHLIADELQARKPIAEIRPLFDHPDVGVRYWAVGQFHTIDPEWASAVYGAVRENLSTGEVVALVQRAKRKPPKRPALSDMSIAELVQRFEDASIRLSATRFMSDENGLPEIKNYNRIRGEISNIAKELEARQALATLLPLMQHSNLFVRHMAATQCLPIASDLAVPVLEAVNQGNEPGEGMFAWLTLYQWRKKQGTTSAE